MHGHDDDRYPHRPCDDHHSRDHQSRENWFGRSVYLVTCLLVALVLSPWIFLLGWIVWQWLEKLQVRAQEITIPEDMMLVYTSAGVGVVLVSLIFFIRRITGF